MSSSFAATIFNPNQTLDPGASDPTCTLTTCYIQASTTSLSTGTVVNSTLRWNGTAWVENTGFLTNSGNSTNTNSTTTNTWVSNILSALTAIFTNLTSTNATVTNATTTNFSTTLLTSSATSTFNGKVILNSAVVDSFGATGTINQVLTSTGTSTKWVTSPSSLPTGTATNTTLRWNGSAWVENTTFLTDASGNATWTNGTSTNIFSTNSSITNSTSTNLFAVLANFITAYFTNLGFSSATGTNIQLANASTSILSATTSATIASTTLTGNTITSNTTNTGTLLVAGSTTLASTTLTNVTLSALAAYGSSTFATSTFNGKVILNSAVVDSFGATGTANQILTSTGTSTKWVSLSTGSIASGTATNTTLRWNGSAWVENTSFLADSTGNATWTNSTSTQIFSTNASITNSTSTNIFALLLNAITGYITNLYSTNATITNATSSNIAVNNLIATSTLGVGTTTNIYGGALTTGATLNNALVIASSTNLSTSTYALYNVNGALYWNGSSVASPLVASTSTSSPQINLATSASSSALILTKNVTGATTWTARSASEANTWYSVTYGNGLFVAVSIVGSNQVMTSPDGITWTARAASEANLWISVTYGNGLFVAVSNNGTNRVMTSPDGITWTARAAAAANPWFAVTYGNGQFVAVSTSGANQVMTSPDGITWTARTASAANQWRSVVYGNGLYVAVASTGTNRVMTSPDGITWTARTEPSLSSLYSVAYGNGRYVAVANSGTDRVIYSTDGINWTSVNVAANTWNSVTYGNGLFVATSLDGTNRVMTSQDGVSWIPQTQAQSNSWQAVTYGNNQFVAVSADGTNRVMTSPINPSAVFTAQTIGNQNTLYVDSTGMVGIGTSSLTSALTVVGGISATGISTFATSTFNGKVILNSAVVDSFGATGTANQILTSTGTSTKWVSLSTGSIASGTATNSTLRWDGTNWVENTGFQTNGGNATWTNGTSTQIFSTNASITNSTSTNMFAVLLNAITGYITNLYSTNATITNATSSNIAVNNLIATSTLGVGTTTNIYGGALTTGATLNNALVLASSTNLSTSTYALYNNNGTLYWNGSALGGGSASGAAGAIQLSNGAGGFVSTTTLNYATSTNILTFGPLSQIVRMFSSTGTGANNSLFLGSNAGNSSTTNTGGNNNAFGLNALSSITSGNYNSAFGSYALENNTTGIQNTAIGGYALNINATGSYNTAVGVGSLEDFISGIDNVGLGRGSLGDLVGGYRNTALGSNAGISALNINDNILIGNAVTNYSGKDAFLNIGNSIYGNNLATVTAFNAGIGINASTSIYGGDMAAGLTIGQNNVIQIYVATSTANVSTSSYALYNINGSLYWNGAPVISSGSLASGTATNSTLRWNGSNWVENLNFLSDASGNSTSSNGTSSNYWVSGVLSALTAIFTNLTSTNATITSATTTNIFATTASNTNLYASNFTLATGTINNLMITGGTTTSSNGLNLLSGCFAVNGTCLTNNSSYQWATTTNSMIYYNSGNVGIGTSSPYYDAKLTVSIPISQTFTTPSLIAGADAGGSTTGTMNLSATNITVVGNYAYVGYAGNTGACTGTAGNTNGCEFKIFDISSTTNPVYMGGGDIGGATNSGTIGVSSINKIAIYGNYAYIAINVSGAGNCTAATTGVNNYSQCAVQVWNISNPASPTIVAGINGNGALTDGNASIDGVDLELSADGKWLYLVTVASSGIGNTCDSTTTAGTAENCELKVFRSMEQGSVNYFVAYDFNGAQTIRSDASGAGTMTGNFYSIKRSANGALLYAGTDNSTEFRVLSIVDPYNITVTGGYNLNTGQQITDIEVEPSGTYVFTVSAANATACNNGAGSATGCEINMLNVSNTNAITNVAGIDSGGQRNAGTQAIVVQGVSYNNGYLYVARSNSATACSSTAGSQGCEFMVIGATSTSPFYLMGFDASGSANSGTTNTVAFSDVGSNGSYVYVTGSGSATACSGVAGSAVGCELKVFNVSSDEILTSGYALSVIGRAIGTSWESLSDRNLKENFVEFGTSTLDNVLTLKPTKYNFKGDSKVRYGFIAQEVKEVMPELVSENNGILSMDYLGLIAPTVKAIQDLNNKIFAGSTTTAVSIEELTASSTISVDAKLKALGTNVNEVNKLLAGLNDLNATSSTVSTSTITHVSTTISNTSCSVDSQIGNELNGGIIKSVSVSTSTIEINGVVPPPTATCEVATYSTTTEEKVEMTFIGKMFARITTWLGDATNGITNIFAKNLNAEEKICLGQVGNQVCMTKDQLERLLQNNVGSPVTSSPSTNENTTVIPETGTTTGATVTEDTPVVDNSTPVQETTQPETTQQ